MRLGGRLSLLAGTVLVSLGLAVLGFLYTASLESLSPSINGIKLFDPLTSVVANSSGDQKDHASLSKVRVHSGSSTFPQKDVSACKHPPVVPPVNTSSNAFSPEELHLSRFICPEYYDASPDAPKFSQRQSLPSSGGMCIAIPTVPRPERRGNTSKLLLNLLRDLWRKRSNSSVGAALGLHAIVYSAACTSVRTFAQAPATGGPRLMWEPLTPPSAAQAPMAHLEIADLHAPETAQKHLREARAAAASSPLPTAVVGPSSAVCQLVSDVDFLQQVVPMRYRIPGDWPVWQWRTKETLDACFALRQCLRRRPAHVLLLEDDTRPAWGYDRKIEAFLELLRQRNQSWGALALYRPASFGWRNAHAERYTVPCCTQAILLNASVAPALLAFLEQRFLQGPVDWLLRQWLESSGAAAFVHVPSLFQHEGLLPTRRRRRADFHFDHQFLDIDKP